MLTNVKTWLSMTLLVLDTLALPIKQEEIGPRIFGSAQLYFLWAFTGPSQL